jgi:hypothetical protein
MTSLQVPMKSDDVDPSERSVESEPDTNNLSGANCFDNQLGSLGRDVPIPMDSFDPIYEVPPAGLVEPTHFYIWGRITYDLTPDGTEHITAFCLQPTEHKSRPDRAASLCPVDG